MKERTVSIIVPTKNAGYYLDEQLSAIFNQEGIPRPEVILVDSGSKDATLRIAERYPVKAISIKPEEFDGLEGSPIAIHRELGNAIDACRICDYFRP